MSLLSRRVLYSSVSAKPEVIHGKGSLGVLRNLPGDNYLVLASNSFTKTDSFVKLKEKTLANKKYDLEIIRNSFENRILEIRDKYLKWPPDLVIAIGGGSVLDSAKLIRHFLSFSEDSLDILAKKLTNPIPKVKLVSIPTTPNTGSEINNIAVVKKDNGDKTPFINKSFTPDLSVIDPVLLSSIPKELMFDFVSDIFAHAFEGSRSRLSNAILKNKAFHAISDLKTNLDLFANDPSNYEAIENIQVIGQEAGTVAESAFVGIIHSLAHGLESLTGASHGSCLHALNTPMMNWISETSTEHKFNFSFYQEVWNSLNLQETANRSLIKNADANAWAKLTLSDPSHKTDPIKFKEENIKELISWLQSTN